MAKKLPGEGLPVDDNEDKSKSEKPEQESSDQSDEKAGETTDKKEGDDNAGALEKSTGDADMTEQSGDMPDQKSKSGKLAGIIDMVYTGTAESTYTESAYHADSLKRPFNPDPLVMRDWSYRIYEEMLEDDQISIAMQIKKDLVVGSGFTIETKDDSQVDIKKDLEIAITEDPDRPLVDILEDILQAYEFGFSISEKIFKNRKDGSLCLRDVKARHPATWLLHTDPHGNMQRYEQRGNVFKTVDAASSNAGGRRNAGGSIDVNPLSVIHYINNPRHQNPYGRSDMFPAYQAWMTKRHITRFYAIFLEKAASPTPVAKYDRRAPQETINQVFDAIKKFQTKTAITIPKEFEIEFLESKSNGEAYVKGINLFNMFIGRALFIPDLMGFQGSETGGGSFALGKDQIGLAFRHIYRRRAILERIVDMHIIRPLCMYNHGLTENFPKFKFNALSDDDAMKQGELWIKAMQGKLWKPTVEEVNHMRSICKFPQSDDVELYGAVSVDPVTGEQIQGPPEKLGKPGEGEDGEQTGADGKIGSADKGEEDVGGGGPDSLETNGKKSAEGKKAPQSKEEKPQEEKSGAETEDVKKKSFALKLEEIPGDYHKKVDFVAAERTLKQTVQKIMDDSKEIQKQIFEDLYDQIQKKKILPKKDLSLADGLKLKNKKQLQLVLKRRFRELYKEAQAQAKVEVSSKSHARNVPSDDFLTFLDQETFNYIGDWEYTVLKRTRAELVSAIKDGKSLSDVIGILDDEGQKLSEVSLERYARTKTTEVFNKGRMEHFESTGVVEAYQYSAVLDDRTSSICEELDGHIFEAGDAPIPPLHFNCRSVLIPITRFEDYKVSEETSDGQDMDEFIDENIGKGFPRN